MLKLTRHESVGSLIVISNDRVSNTQGVDFTFLGFVISSFRLYHFLVIFIYFFSRCGRPFTLFYSKTSFRLSNNVNSCLFALVVAGVVVVLVLVVVVVVVVVVVDVVVVVAS